jgi:hypothetical protein
MFNISKYLEKVSKNLTNDENIKSEIIKIIKKNINIDINPKDLEINNEKIKINTSQAVKNKIFINKEIILQEVNTIGLKYKVTDIN